MSLREGDLHIATLKEILAAGYDLSQDSYGNIDVCLKPTSLHLRAAPECSTSDPFLLKFLGECAKTTPCFWEQTFLMDAVLIGTQDDVTSCLQNNDILFRKNIFGQSAVHLSVLRSAILSQLLQAGAEVNIQDKYGRTPLEYAAIYGFTNSVLILLEKGALPVCCDENNQQHIVFLNHAMQLGHWDLLSRTFSYLKSSRCYSKDFLNKEINHLMAAYTKSSYEMSAEGISCLVKLAADPNLILDNGDTLIHRISNYKTAKALFETGFNYINHPNLKGISPLISAAASCNLDLWKAIVNMGGDVHHRDLRGRSALHIIVDKIQWSWIPFDDTDLVEKLSERTAMVATLLDQGIDPLIRDNCRCHCSRNGCSTSTIVSKRLGDWWLEWLLMLTQYRGVDTAQEAFLDLVRSSQFNKLEMTHVCCYRKNSYKTYRFVPPLDEEEVDEILDEEKYLIQELEDFVENISVSNNKMPQEHWLDVLSKYSTPEREGPYEMWSWSQWPDLGGITIHFGFGAPAPAIFQQFPAESRRVLEISRPSKLAGYRCYISESTDTFEWLWGPVQKQEVSDSQRYIDWLEHIYKNPKKYNFPMIIDQKWYKHRKHWAIRKAEVFEAARLEGIAS